MEKEILENENNYFNSYIKISELNSGCNDVNNSRNVSSMTAKRPLINNNTQKISIEPLN